MKSMKPKTVSAKIRIISTTFFLLLFPVIFYYLSPVIPLAGASEGIITGSLIIFGLMFIFSIFFGRLFCSYICPGGKIEDLVEGAQNKKFRRTRFNWIKYLIWIPWVFMLLFLFWKTGGVNAVNFTYMTVSGISVSDVPSLIIFIIVSLVFFILPLLFGRRAACHTICWMAPFMIAGKKLGKTLNIPSLHISADKDSCIHCLRCNERCVMSIDVERYVDKENVDTTDCILCSECVDACPVSALSLKWSRQ